MPLGRCNLSKAAIGRGKAPISNVADGSSQLLASLIRTKYKRYSIKVG